MPAPLLVLTSLSALGCALIAGVFFAFSAFVMDALGRLAPSQGLAAMQSINEVVVNPAFLGAFFGTALGCLGVALAVPWAGPAPAGALSLAGSLLYLAGTLGVTVVINVPLNRRLARAAPRAPDAARIWSSYLRRWTRWNHVRTAAALLAAAALMAAVGNG